jgi:hypothetical protein
VSSFVSVERWAACPVVFFTGLSVVVRSLRELLNHPPKAGCLPSMVHIPEPRFWHIPAFGKMPVIWEEYGCR